MRIERFPVKVKRETLEQFADRHGLTMEIHEQKRTAPMFLPRYCAYFSDVRVEDGSSFSSRPGDGETEDNAIRDYVDKISEKLLVVDAFGPNRREIWAPRLIPTWTE